MKTNKKITNVLCMAAVTALACFVLIKSYIPDNYDVDVGDICPEDIFATGDIVDEVTTAELKEQAMDLVQPNLEVVLGARSESMSKAEKILNNVRNGKYADYAGIGISEGQAELLEKMNTEEFEQLTARVKKAIEIIMTQSVSEENFSEMEEKLEDELVNAGVGEGYIDLAYSIAKSCLKVNITLDFGEEYEKQRRESAEKVQPVTYKKDAKIIGRGEVIEKKHYAMMAQMGYIKDKTSFNVFSHLGRVVFTVVMLVLVWLYLSIRKKVFYDKHFSAYCAVVALTLLIILLFVSQEWNCYPAPILMLSMLTAILFGSKISYITNAVVFIVAAMAFDGRTDILVSGIVAGSFSSVLLSKVTSRSRIFYIAILCAVLYGGLICAYDFGINTSVMPVLTNALLAFSGAVISGIAAVGLVPFMEILFGILTPFKLTEYTNFESPLLKRMVMEAPGTYHHSIMVGNLAEGAADAIGANALLTRAGAYYHDIGKLTNPHMFKENQYYENPHDYMTPERSASYILAHTKDGMEMAKKYKLPKELADFINQHHGTTTTAYFYHKAKEENPDADVKAFTYDGIKPQTRETAVVMLADTVEAAIRSISDYTFEEMEQFIAKLIKGKTDDGQLSECDISFKDIEKIKMSFIYTLKGYFHKRVKYPEQEKNNED